jgi:N-sulfoglucosamine sulfohydrolase
LIFILICTFACNQKEKQQAANQEPPNFILFITDYISYNDLGFYGNEFAKTPNLDKMASEGLLFTNAYLTVSSSYKFSVPLILDR